MCVLCTIVIDNSGGSVIPSCGSRDAATQHKVSLPHTRDHAPNSAKNITKDYTIK